MVAIRDLPPNQRFNIVHRGMATCPQVGEKLTLGATGVNVD